MSRDLAERVRELPDAQPNWATSDALTAPTFAGLVSRDAVLAAESTPAAPDEEGLDLERLAKALNATELRAGVEDWPTVDTAGGHHASCAHVRAVAAAYRAE